MNTLRNPWRLAAACGLILIVATACYQNIDEDGNPAALSMGLPTATLTPFPTATDTPTPTEEFIAEVVTEEAPQEATLDFSAFETPTEAFTFDDPNATPDLLDFDTLQLTFNAPPPQDVLLGDTGGPFGTPTPTPFTVVQIDNFSLTSTQFVLQVTQTQEASFTQTAVALGIGEEPTIPPFVTDVPDIFFPSPTPTPFDLGRPAVCIHIVQPGENLFRLSLRYGVSVNDLAVANGISNIQLIRVNQQITIPGCGTTGVFPPPTPLPAGTGGIGGPGDTVTGQSVAICNQHLVQQYETLFQISLRYGVSMQSIINANNITNPNIIIMATTLQIPCA
ncbi:MAG: LysM peptidoglycan-binding domain-containing protein [Anaerolinea sp.]